MQSSNRPVVVKQMPERMNLKQARKFLREVQPLLNADRPQVVFDMSQVRHIDAAGVDVLLQCMGEVMKRDGDLKLAAPSPQVAVVLELTRTGRLFEIYGNSASAVRSFSCFLPDAISLAPSGENVVALAVPEPLNNDAVDDGSAGGQLAA